MNPTEIRQQITQRAEQANAILRQASDRDLTEDEQARADALATEMEALERRAAALERMDSLAASLRESSGRAGSPLPHEVETRHRYSLLHAVTAIADGRPLNGLEAETSQEMAKRQGRAPKGFFMPLGLPVDPRTEQRDLTTTTGAGAIQTTVRTDLMTDALRGALVCARAGAQVLTDMDGAFSVPKQSAATTFEWVAEGGSPSGSNAVIGSQGYTPRTLTGFVDITRTFMKQTSLDAEAFARRDLTLGIAGALDAAALNGSGTGREPAGLRTLAGITTIALGTNGAAPTWDAIVALETAVANANIAIEQGAPAYVMTPKARGAMKTQLVNANAPGVFLWGLNVDGTRTVGTVNGYPAFATSYLPSTLTKGSGTGLSSMIFGDFSYLLMALWGGVDILVNPYAGNAGSVRLNIFQDADVAPRRAEAFARINDMVAA